MQQITRDVLATLQDHEGFAELDSSLKELIIEQVAKLSEMDMLTGVANRVKVQGVIETEWARSVRYHSPISLIMFDVDGLQKINESYGHESGDAILEGIAQTVEHNIRTTDLVGRWDSDEFLLIVPTTNSEQATWLANKLKVLIEEHMFPNAGQVTCSFGVADRDDAMDIEDWIRIAAVAHREAKVDRGNKVVGYDSIAYKDL